MPPGPTVAVTYGSIGFTIFRLFRKKKKKWKSWILEVLEKKNINYIFECGRGEQNLEISKNSVIKSLFDNPQKIKAVQITSHIFYTKPREKILKTRGKNMERKKICVCIFLKKNETKN